MNSLQQVQAICLFTNGIFCCFILIFAFPASKSDSGRLHYTHVSDTVCSATVVLD